MIPSSSESFSIMVVICSPTFLPFSSKMSSVKRFTLCNFDSSSLFETEFILFFCLNFEFFIESISPCSLKNCYF